MIVSKQNLSALVETLIAQIVINGIKEGWPETGYSVYCSYGYNASAINFDVAVGHPDPMGADLTISHKGKTIGIVRIKNTIIFQRSSLASDLAKWREQTSTYLSNQLGKFLAEKFVDEDPTVSVFFKDVLEGAQGGNIHISGIRFNGLLRGNSGWFVVKQGSHTLIHLERTNALGMTTAQGWQAMNGNTIISEFRRTLVALVANTDDFKYSVDF